MRGPLPMLCRPSVRNSKRLVMVFMCNILLMAQKEHEQRTLCIVRIFKGFHHFMSYRNLYAKIRRLVVLSKDQVLRRNRRALNSTPEFICLVQKLFRNLKKLLNSPLVFFVRPQSECLLLISLQLIPLYRLHNSIIYTYTE